MGTERSYFPKAETDAMRCDMTVLRDELGEPRCGKGEKALRQCPFCGHNRLSTFRGRGDGAALWRCYSCQRGGDIFSLFQQRDGLDFYSAVEAVMNRYGRSASSAPRLPRPQRPARPLSALPDDRPALPANDDTAAATTSSTASAPQLPDRPELNDWQRACMAYCVRSQQRLISAMNGNGGKGALDALAWLHRRGLRDDTLKRFHVGFDGKAMWRGFVPGGVLDYGRPAVILPYGKGSFYYAARFLKPFVDDDGKEHKLYKPDSAGAGGEPVFNAVALWAGFEAVLVVEGQLDCMAIVQAAATASRTANVGAVAINGAGNHSRLLELLRRPAVGRLIVALDDDDAGRTGAAALSAKLDAIGQQHDVIDAGTLWGCWTKDDRTGSTCKDAGDVLQEYGDDALAVCIELALDEPATVLWHAD